MIKTLLATLSIFSLLFILGCDSKDNKQNEISKKKVKVVAKRKAVPMQEPTKILRIVPDGVNIQNKKEIVFQFDRDMVPLGDMARTQDEISINIEPKLNCEWRWLSRSALACRLDEENKLKHATRYVIESKEVISLVDGVRVAEPFRHVFSTMRPKVEYSNVELWKSPTKPYLYVQFNMPVTKESVLKSLKIKRVGYSEALHVDIIEKKITNINNVQTKEYLDDTSAQNTMKKRWIITPRKKLLADTKYKLVEDMGIKTNDGKLVGLGNDNVRDFFTFGPFNMIGLKCEGQNDYKIFKQLEIIENNIRCAPLSRVGFVFSSPVKQKMFAKYAKLNPPLNGGRKDYDPWANSYDYSQLNSNHYEHSTYTIWMPEHLRGYKDYKIMFDENNFEDEFGRTLNNIEITKFKTDHRRPELRMTHSNVVLEKGVKSYVPVYATNLDDIKYKFNRSVLGASNISQYSSRKIKTMDVTDISYKTKVGVRKILQGKSGVVYGKISSSSTKYPSTLFAQVTPFQVHAKLGHYNSLVWVTSFATGEPVANAKVVIKKGYLNNLDNLDDITEYLTTDENGMVNLDGINEFNPNTENLRWTNTDGKQYFIGVQKDNDTALLPLKYDYIINSSSTYSSMRQHGGHIKTWGASAQGVYKVGDKVEFKIYVRDQDNESLVSPDKYYFSLEVTDPMNKLVYSKDKLELNEFGSLDSSFKLDKNAAVGSYSFKLTHKSYDNNSESTNHTWYPLSILVSDFTPASFGVKTELNGDSFKAGDSLEISSIATMYSGGPYTKAQTRVSAHLFSKNFHSKHPKAKGFDFSSAGYGDIELLNIKEVLDNKGEIKTTLNLKETSISYGELFIESSVKDERGKYVAASKRVTYSQRDRFVGLKDTKWVYDKNKKEKIKVIVVDEKGTPQSGVKVDVKIQYKEYKSVRVKGAGNSFITQNSSKWVDDGTCSLTSSKDAKDCSFTPTNVGSYRFVATIKDTKGKENKTTMRSWVSGSGAIVWDQGNNSNLEIIPENTSYKVGEKARYLVKNPFPGAKALVTIERNGILKSWVQTLKTGTPIIEFEIEPQYIPGFYFSVVVVSPRVKKPLGDGLVDLGKPSYKMGYVRCNVSDKYKELEVSIKTNKEVYEPSQMATVSLHVGNKEYSTNNEDYEIALVVIDESVLALNPKGTRYYNPNKGFNYLESLDVTNYSLISRLIGRQKFEKKGVNPGGDGGASISATSLRNNFKYIAYWNPSIITDKKGNAKVKFKMPDNLTGWRIMAIVVDRDDKMGLGKKNIKTSKSTEIRPVMPNQVLQGDKFSAGFNIMNRSDKARTLKVVIDVLVDGKKPTKKELSIKIPAYDRKNIYVPIEADKAGKVSFKIKAADKIGGDGLTHSLVVHKRKSLDTMSNFGSTMKNKIVEDVTVPEGIIADVGEVGVVLSSSVVGNTEGAFSYIKDYPYWCWEQRLTKAVAAAQYKALKKYLPESLEWKEAKSLTNKMLSDSSSFQASNGGMAFWIASNRYVSPYLSAYTALEFAWLKKQGYKIPQDVEKKLHAYLNKMLTNDIMPSYFSPGMTSTVRAVALNALAMSGKLSAQNLNRYARHSDSMSLFGKANYLQAALAVKGVDDSIKSNVLTSILATSTQSAAKFSFNENADSGSSYLLSTPVRANCAILSALIDASKDKKLKKLVADIPPKVVRTITQTRGDKNHWENTQENIFCMSAIVDYAKVYESTPVNMSVDVSFDKKQIAKTTFKSLREPSKRIFKEIKAEDIGKKTSLEINRKGSGRLYYISRISFARKAELSDRVNSGIEIRREYAIERNNKFEILKSPINIKQGDIVRVDLFVSLPTARNFVVVDDHVPGGLEPINSDLATTSVIDAQKANLELSKDSWIHKIKDWSTYGEYGWSFYHKELRHNSARFYADYLPAGNYHLSYTAQAIAAGEFGVMPSHVEEMYDPDVYGKSLPLKLNIAK